MTLTDPEPDLTRPAPTSSVVVARIRSRLDELTEPRVQRTRQWVPVDGADRLEPRDIEVRMPGLLVQLADPAAKSTAGSSSSGPTSRPPSTLEGIACLQLIEREASVIAASMLARMLTAALPGVHVLHRPRRTVDAIAVVRHFVDDLPRDTLLDVDRTVRQWWARARVVTTWDVPPFKPHSACPNCWHVGRLRLLSRPTVLLCLECGEAWDTAGLAELGTIYQLALAAVPTELSGAVTP